MENIIKKISAIIAGSVIYLLVSSFYLSLKGFVPDSDKFWVFKPAYAEEENLSHKEIQPNFAFPQDHILGNADAKVTIYEYSSFGCSHCADLHVEVMPKIIKEYVDTGLIKLGFVPLPLDKNSMDAALLAECVQKDRYFEFANTLFKKQRDWMLAFEPLKVMKQLVLLAGVNADKANVCLKDDTVAARILGDRKSAIDELGIVGTPSLIISSPLGNEMISGGLTFDNLSGYIDEHLQSIQ